MTLRLPPLQRTCTLLFNGSDFSSHVAVIFLKHISHLNCKTKMAKHMTKSGIGCVLSLEQKNLLMLSFTSTNTLLCLLNIYKTSLLFHNIQETKRIISIALHVALWKQIKINSYNVRNTLTCNEG